MRSNVFGDICRNDICCNFAATELAVTACVAAAAATEADLSASGLVSPGFVERCLPILANGGKHVYTGKSEHIVKKQRD
jgi:hypothetical protein|nr:hypothetical protein [uncultured Acetatifactor sp.]